MIIPRGGEYYPGRYWTDNRPGITPPVASSSSSSSGVRPPASAIDSRAGFRAFAGGFRAPGESSVAGLSGPAAGPSGSRSVAPGPSRAGSGASGGGLPSGSPEFEEDWDD